MWLSSREILPRGVDGSWWDHRDAESEVPFESEAFQQLYAGSSCFLWVPEYIETNTEQGATK